MADIIGTLAGDDTIFIVPEKKTPARKLARKLSLLFGLFTRLSAAFGIMLMGVYWMAHMDFPFIENRNNFLIDFHIVYAFVLAWLIAHRGGIVLGLDSWAGKLPIVRNNALLRWATGAA